MFYPLQVGRGLIDSCLLLEQKCKMKINSTKYTYVYIKTIYIARWGFVVGVSTLVPFPLSIFDNRKFEIQIEKAEINE